MGLKKIKSFMSFDLLSSIVIFLKSSDINAETYLADFASCAQVFFSPLSVALSMYQFSSWRACV